MAHQGGWTGSGAGNSGDGDEPGTAPLPPLQHQHSFQSSAAPSSSPSYSFAHTPQLQPSLHSDSPSTHPRAVPGGAFHDNGGDNFQHNYNPYHQPPSHTSAASDTVPSVHGYYDAEPAARPLSYFPTHHQPLVNQYYDGHDDDHDLNPRNQYETLKPLEHASTSLSPRSGSGSSSAGGDIPMVGIVSSNIHATENSMNHFSENNGGYAASAAGGQGGAGGSGSGAFSYGGNAAGVGTNADYARDGHAPMPASKDYAPAASGYDPEAPAPPASTSHRAVDENGEPVPKALLDPKVQKQLNNRRTWRPWFVWVVTIAQVVILVYEFVRGYQATGSFIATNPFNPMIGPGSGTLIAMGSRFTPCMRSTYLDNLQIECPDDRTKVCTISDICAFTPIASTGQPPNQWFRFIVPIFLHGGVIHLLFNLMFQVRTGADLERDMGFIRFGIIYMTSGIVGFVFGANFAPMLSPSMGASGALFGLIGCLLLDLLQNWRLVINPCWELTKLVGMILFSFLLGLLPGLDNFAHIGGFLAGILSGLIFMPAIFFSKRDKLIKLGLRVIALPLLILILVLGITNFYSGNPATCSWCRLLDCLPINGWCDAFDAPQPNNGTTTP
ncbi:hypothetical protein DFQ26_006707 [Actinomortierella ambigua]|nr:hypothetical protein DFQ26_006707 [Actinomortierella ambigua]